MKDKLTALQQKEVKLKARICRIKAQDLSKKNKQSMRLKILIGASVLDELGDFIDADSQTLSDKKKTLKEMLNRHVTRKGDRLFLRSFDLIDDDDLKD